MSDRDVETAKIFNLGWGMYEACLQRAHERYGLDLVALATQDPARALELLMEGVREISPELVSVRTVEGKTISAEMDGVDATLAVADRLIGAAPERYGQVDIEVYTVYRDGMPPDGPEDHHRQLVLAFTVQSPPATTD